MNTWNPKYNYILNGKTADVNQMKLFKTSKIWIYVYSEKWNIRIIYENTYIISNHIICVSFVIQMTRNARASIVLFVFGGREIIRKTIGIYSVSILKKPTFNFVHTRFRFATNMQCWIFKHILFYLFNLNLRLAKEISLSLDDNN